MSRSNTVDIYIDGSSRGNPGKSGIGIIFTRDGHTFKNISEYIGVRTNNYAEYAALIHALRVARSLDIEAVRVFSDSELLCKQIHGEYRVKNEAIKHLYAQATALIGAFKSVEIHKIPRESNKGADKLARLAGKHQKSKTDEMAARSR